MATCSAVRAVEYPVAHAPPGHVPLRAAPGIGERVLSRGEAGRFLTPADRPAMLTALARAHEQAGAVA
jgi:hypothetical protein